MDSELRAIREARLAQLRNQSALSSNNKNNSNIDNTNSNGNANQVSGVSSTLTPFLEQQALERLSRVSLVRPERVAAVEQYLQRIISSGQLRHKINENEIVQILNGISKQENSHTDSKIIFERKDSTDPFDPFDVTNNGSKKQNNNSNSDSEDDFFDE